MVYLRGRGLVENEEQDENKKMKSIVVEEHEQEQEQEQEEGSETRVVDLDKDTLLNVLGRVDWVTLERAACVNKLWCRVAMDERLWEPILIRYLAGIGRLRYIDRYRTRFSTPTYIRYWAGIRGLKFRLHILRWIISDMAKPPPDFYSIDFSKKIRPWR